MAVKDSNTWFSISAAWYLTFFTTQSGTVAAAPLFLTFFISFFLPRNEERRRPNLFWPAALVAYGGYSLFTVWLNSGYPSDAETAVKYIAGGILAWRFSKNQVNINWIIAGSLSGAILTIALTILMYGGEARFSVQGNVIKWGNVVSYQAILMVSLGLLSKSRLLLGLFVLMGAATLYVALLSGTRGAVLPWLIFVPIILVFALRRVSKTTITALLLLSTVGATLLFSADSTTKRVEQTQQDVRRILGGNFNGSIGIRLVMIDIGLQAGMNAPLLGSSYRLSENIKNYEPTFPDMRTVIPTISSWQSKLHNTYVDTFSSKGLVGVVLLLFVMLLPLKGSTQAQRILLLSPVIGVPIAGLADSTFDIGPTVEYFLISCLVFTATKTDE